MPTIIDEVSTFLQTPLPLDKKDLVVDLQQINKYTLPVLEELNKSRLFLVQQRERFRHPTEKGITDFDRRIMLEDGISDYSSSFDTLEALSVALERRFSSISMLLR